MSVMIKSFCGKCALIFACEKKLLQHYIFVIFYEKFICKRCLCAFMKTHAKLVMIYDRFVTCKLCIIV